MTETNRTLAGEHRIRYGDMSIRFLVRVQPERRVAWVAIPVEPDGRMLVGVPPDATQDAVLAAVRKRSRWIGRHVDAAMTRRGSTQPRQYVSGESLMYLGRRYRLKVQIDPGAPVGASLRAGYLVVSVPQMCAERVRGGMEAWYRERARELYGQRLAAVAVPLRWIRQLPPTRLRHMTVQWGSCSPAGRITLNPLLVKAPRECIDYVVLHELIHLQHHHHGPAFYRALDRHMPGWRAVKAKLDGMAEDIFRA
jgi:predicted metal-dependent hydrolase